MNESSLTLTQSKEICISITAMTAEFSWINNLDTIRSEIFRNFSEAKAFIEREQIQKKFALTDLGNVERFINLYPNEIRYVPEIAEFYFFDGKKWALDLGSKRTHELVDQTVRSIYHEARRENEKTSREEIAKWALHSEHGSRRDAMVKDLKYKLMQSVDDFDCDPWLFNVLSGTIDLRTGLTLPHKYSDFLMKLAPVNFDILAECPLWNDTLNLFFKKNKSIIEYVQKLFGYSMTGVNNERIIIFLYGRGRNGKTTITNTILKIFGDYAAAADITSFIQSKMGKQAGSATEDIARLRGKRYVRTSEVGGGDKLNEKLVKDISGGDIITARHLYRGYKDFTPTFTLWLFGNEKIKIDGQDTGIKDRVKFINLDFQIPAEQEDKQMRERLFAEEASGILNWLLVGCLRWQSEGLAEPIEITSATAEFFDEQDAVGQFLLDCCICGEMNVIKFSAFYDAFIEYSVVYMSKQRFSKILHDKGYKIEAGANNKKFIFGISLKNV